VAGAIVFALRQADTGTVVAEVCRKMGISEATFYNWNRGGGPQKVWGAGRSRASAAPTVRSGRRAEENQ
jgi:putative transposase